MYADPVRVSIFPPDPRRAGVFAPSRRIVMVKALRSDIEREFRPSVGGSILVVALGLITGLCLALARAV